MLFGAHSMSASGVRRLTIADAQRTIDLREGERLEVTLSGNPTTGYSWELDSVDESILRSLGKPRYAASSGATGSGGEFIFAFEAKAPGKTELRLVYCRPWEKGTKPAESFAVTVLCAAP